MDKIFQRSFQNLDNGGDIIDLLSNKIFSKLKLVITILKNKKFNSKP